MEFPGAKSTSTYILFTQRTVVKQSTNEFEGPFIVGANVGNIPSSLNENQQTDGTLAMAIIGGFLLACSNKQLCLAYFSYQRAVG